MKIFYIKIDNNNLLKDYKLDNIREKKIEKFDFEILEIDQSEKINLLNSKFTNNEIDVIELLENIHKYSVEHYIDYTILTIGCAYFLSKKKLFNLINDFIDSKSLIGARFSAAKGSHMLFDSLRSPLLDLHFILLNNKKLQTKNFFCNTKTIYNHSNKIAGQNAKCFSFFERNLKKNELFNFYSSKIVNQYENDFNTLYVPYSLCIKYGLVTCYSLFDTKLINLLKINLGLKINNLSIKFFYYQNNNYYFIRRFFLKYINLNLIRSLLKLESLLKFSNTADAEGRAKSYVNTKDDRFKK